MSKFDPYEHQNISLNPDGSLTRYIRLPTSAAVSEADAEATGQSVVSKDVTLDANKNTWVRIYRPAKLPAGGARLPIILFFHSGGWIYFSVAQTLIHESNNRIAAGLPAVLVAVEYRLAPEHRLPAQYEDAMDAVVWLGNQAGGGGDPWIRDHGDMDRCYLYGSSCGANIAFNAAMRVKEMEPQPVRIAGTIMNQPFIGGKKRTKSELKLATDPYFPLPVQDMLWELALPVGVDRDHRFCNPFASGAVKQRMRNLGRCLVIGFGGDPLIDRQQEFVQVLVEQGVQVEAKFDDVGFHGIDMIDARRAIAILSFIQDFLL